MSDIVPQAPAKAEGIKTVEGRLEGQGGRMSGREQPSKRATALYAETARTSPTGDDRITILGIPFDQITPATQAALAGLVSEINYLRSLVKRLERGQPRAIDGGPAAPFLEPTALFRAIDGVLAQVPEPGMTWVAVLVYIATYADIRRSSGLLAANAVLADVAQRLRDVDFPVEGSPQAQYFAVLGHAGGATLAGIVALPSADFDGDNVADRVREKLLAVGYKVGGIDMTLALSTASAAVGAGESALLALARTDHLLLRPPARY